MRKRHKPITQAQIDLLMRLKPFSGIYNRELESVREEMIGRALHQKRLAQMWFDRGGWVNGDICYEPCFRLRITPLGKRYLSFISTLSTK